MKIVVTGAAGGIGTYLVPAIRERHPTAEVVGVSRFMPGDIHADLSNPRDARRALRGADVVVHAAAPRYVPGADASQALRIATRDARIATNVAMASAGAGWIVLLSSATVYGPDLSSPCELDAANGGTAMGDGKRMIEEISEGASLISGPILTTWRLFNVMTPVEPHDVLGHVQVDLFRQIVIEKRPLIALKGGLARRSFTWVGDVANAMAAYLMDVRVDGKTLNLGTRDARSLVELATAILRCAKELGVVPANYDPKIVATPGTDWTPSVDFAESLIGWTAPTSFEACVEKFVRGKLGLPDRGGAGAKILSLAREHNVITADELPAVVASIDAARTGGGDDN